MGPRTENLFRGRGDGFSGRSEDDGGVRDDRENVAGGQGESGRGEPDAITFLWSGKVPWTGRPKTPGFYGREYTASGGEDVGADPAEGPADDVREKVCFLDPPPSLGHGLHAARRPVVVVWAPCPEVVVTRPSVPPSPGTVYESERE